MRRHRNAKIIATLGPGSSTPEKIEALANAGADVFRLNFSHGAHEDHKARLWTIRQMEKSLGRSFGVLADMQGPKLRVGKFRDEKIMLETGARFRLDLSEELGDLSRAPLLHPEIFEALKVGSNLLLDDGKVHLRVRDHAHDFAECDVVAGGALSNHKGVNVPDAVLNLSALTEKDRRDLDFALDMGVDWIAMSFVQKPEDVAEARRLIDGRAALLSKLEKPSALDYLDEIVDLSDAIMVARGDLGVEIPPERVPMTQKRIVSHCRQAGKPVVVATQMLDSMVSAPTPTRAEASDVATAIFDAADAVMLSAETAVGDYAVESIQMMDRIIRQVENDELYHRALESNRYVPNATAADAICAGARQVAQTLGAAAVVTYTSSGSTTLRAARERPETPILCLTSNLNVARRMTIAWGTHTICTSELTSFSEMVKKACAIAKREELAQDGQRLVIIAGVPFGTPGTTNVLRIAWAEEGED